MKAPIIPLLAAALACTIPTVGLAHTFRFPSYVDSEPGGAFHFRAVLKITEPTIQAYHGWSPDENAMGGYVADCFCEPFCAKQPGDSVVIFVEGTLNNAKQVGVVTSYIALCPSGSYSGTTFVFPAPDLGVDDRPTAASRLWNHPNPVAHRTTFQFAMAKPGVATLRIYDLTGRLRAVPLHESRSAGPQSVTWNLLEGAGPRMEPGIYVARLDAAGVLSTCRVVVTK